MNDRHKGDRRRRRDKHEPSNARRVASKPLLAPNPGPWALDWSLVDRGAAEFPWPPPTERLYSDLAGFLARLNEMSFDDVMSMTRANGKSAVHELEPYDLSTEASAQWEHLYAANQLDEGENADLAVVTISYCLGYGDGRRVVVALNREARRMFPLWWDPEHKVSGSDGGAHAAPSCIDRCLHE